MKRWVLLSLSFALFISGCSLRGGKNTPVQEPPPAEIPTEIPVAKNGEEAPEFSSLPSDNFNIGARLATQASPGLLDFVNQHYSFLMTPILGENARQSIYGPDLILYRSIQGMWDKSNQFDWEHISANENMFEHHQGERIFTIWDAWLMNTDDMVAADDPDALNHWINYYALTASEQIYEYGYDGLFIDSASHKLNPAAVSGNMPDDYDVAEWYTGRVEGLAFIKSYLPDKTVIFNGLHSRAGAEDSLANTDGGMWETFSFKPGSGEYQGLELWQEAIELTARHSDKGVVLVVKDQPGLDNDIQKRVFSVGGYLLVSNENVIFSMTNSEDQATDLPYYYPEYTLDFGAPLGAYAVSENGLYTRTFENGIVLVNPYPDQTLTYELTQPYQQAHPVGGGVISADGSWEGSIEYTTVSGQVELPPLSGMLLINP